MPSVLLAIAGALLVVAACYSTGRVLCAGLDLPHTIRFGLGSVAISLLIFGLLAAGVAQSRVLVPLLFLLALPLLRTKPGRFPSLPVGWAGWLLLAAGAAYGFYYLIHALAPEIQPDAATYHLGLVREWLLFDSFPDRTAFYELLPQGLEMLFAPAYAVGKAPAAKLVHFAFLIATIPLLFDTGRRMGLGRTTCGAAALLYAASPVVGVSGTSAYNDAALVFFCLAVFAMLLRFWNDHRVRPFALAGLAGGFCYAIKMTGLLAPAAAVAVLLAARRWKPALGFSAGAALIIAPWMLRSFLATGNPLAPLLNSLFVNPAFHISTEQRLSEILRDYGALPPLERLLELTVGGEALQGLIGPVFLLAPLALMALRDRRGRLLLAVATVLAIPWFLNQGARFLMPSMLFVALALAMALPRPAGVALALVHALLGLPVAMDQYTKTNAWRLEGLPVRAALRLQPESEYLDDVFWEHRVATLVQEHVPAPALVLDLFGAPTAYFDAAVIGPWHSSAADRMREALMLAARPGDGVFKELEAAWNETSVTKLRIVLQKPATADWGLHELVVRGPGGVLADRGGWSLSSWPNVWEARLALDRNRVTRWAVWEPARPGMYFQVNFPSPVALTGATALIGADEQQHQVQFAGQIADGRWLLLDGRPEILPSPALDLRRSAMQVLRDHGVGYIIAPVSNAPFAGIGSNLVRNPAEWGVEVLGNERGVYLLRLAPVPE